MQLNTHTDYALRTLMALAVSGERMTVDDIARKYAISRNHLAKVAQNLQAHGYITTVRGRNGGIELARPAEQINVGEVVRRFENLQGFVGCFPGGLGCAVRGTCGLKPVLSGALGAFLTYLDGYQLDELVPDQKAFMAELKG